MNEHSLPHSFSRNRSIRKRQIIAIVGILFLFLAGVTNSAPPTVTPMSQSEKDQLRDKAMQLSRYPLRTHHCVQALV